MSDGTPSGGADNLELERYQARMRGLFPELLGMRLVSVEPDLLVGELDVRRELCTAPGLMHGGAIMAFADTLGALATMANRRRIGHHDPRIQDQLLPRRPRGLHRTRRDPPAPPRPPHPSLANHHHRRRRQAASAGDSNPNAALEGRRRPFPIFSPLWGEMPQAEGGRRPRTTTPSHHARFNQERQTSAARNLGFAELGDRARILNEIDPPRPPRLR